MLLKLRTFVCSGLLSAACVVSSSGANPPPLRAEVVQDPTLAKLADLLAATALRSQRLRLVMDEKATPLSPSQTAGQALHHVLLVEPGSRRERYDVVDHQTSSKAPYVTSSFTDGTHSGRWESGLKAAELPLLLSGNAAFTRRGNGMCYLGPDVRRSSDVLQRVLGMTMSGVPLPAYVRRLREEGTTLTPDAAGDGVVLQNKYKKLTFDAHGLLKQALMFQPEHGMAHRGGADVNEASLVLVEGISVLETGRLGDVVVPTKISRHVNINGVMIESTYELRLADSRILTAEDITAATNPILPQGTLIANSPSGLGIEKARPAFETVETPINPGKNER